MSELSNELGTALSDAQLAWLASRAAEQTPPVSTGTMLGRLVDSAMGDSDVTARDRAYQLEVFRASGYAEHHPDYPGRRESAGS